MSSEDREPRVDRITLPGTPAWIGRTRARRHAFLWGDHDAAISRAIVHTAAAIFIGAPIVGVIAVLTIHSHAAVR